MPRAIDFKQFQITNDPTRSGTEFHMGALIKDQSEIAVELLNAIAEAQKRTVINAIEELTGLDLSAIGPLLDEMSLDCSSPTALLTSIVHAVSALPEVVTMLIATIIEQLQSGLIEDQFNELMFAVIELLVSLPTLLMDLANALIESGAGLLGQNSPINLLNAFNILSPDLMAQLNFSNIGETLNNLVADPFFEVVEAFTGLGSWFHDGTNSHAAVGGSAMSIADGTLKELLGNLIPVSVGQVLNLSGWAKWSGLTGSGNPIMLAVTGYDTNGSAINQTTVASHNTTPPTTDWTQLAGTYTVPAGVTGIRTRLAVGPTASAGTVWWDDMNANKTQTMFQRLIAGTNPGENLTNDVEHLFGGVVTNTLEILQKASQGDFEGLVSTLVGDVQEGFEDVGDRLNDFLHSLSPLNGSNIATGNIGDQFIGGIGTILNNVVTGLQGVGGSFGHDDALSAFLANAHALVDHGAGISGMAARMSNLESRFAALPVSAGGTGSGNADGGAVGAVDTDLFERTSASNLGALWLQSYSGGSGTWAIPNGHDATFNPSGSSTREFLAIRNNSTIPRSQTDYQRVTMELSSKATRDRDLLGFYDFCGTNDIWLRVSDATTSLANITGIRIRWEGDGALSIAKFTSGSAVTLASLGTGGITPPGPGAQLIGEAGVLADGARFFFRAKIGESIRLTATDATVPTGASNRRWGHGGRAQGASLLVGQTKPGGVHFWNGMDQTL